MKKIKRFIEISVKQSVTIEFEKWWKTLDEMEIMNKSEYNLKY